MDSFTHSGLTFPVSDSSPTGPKSGTFVLLHGFPQGSWAWDSVAPRLVAAGYRVVVPTMRGYTPTARPSGVRAYAVSELVDDVTTLIETISDGPVHLVGHDWGAVVAWACASDRPALVRTVMGVSVPPMKAYLQGLQNPRQLAHSWYAAAFAIPGLMEAAARTPLFQTRLIAALVNSGQTRQRAERDVSVLLSTDGGLTAALSYYRAAPFGAFRHRAPITPPAMFVWSNVDTAVTSAAVRSAARATAGRYRSATLLGVSHWIPEAAPEELAALLLEHAASAAEIAPE